jgi:hypothetical protein
MRSKQSLLILVAILLAGIYVYYFTDWFNRPHIQILAQTRPVQPRNRAARVFPVSFLLDGHYRLTSVKVVPAAAYATNRLTRPLWDLVAYSNASPTAGFVYGQRIPGMRPRMTNSPPQLLEPNTAYRLLVEAGRARGQIEFHTGGPIESPGTP